MPGIALAEELLSLGEEVSFVAGTREVERRILKEKPFPVHHIDVEGFVGRPIGGKIRATFKLGRAFFVALRLLQKIRPSVILAEGGYVSVPLVFVGKLLRIKTALHEQNVIPGRANLLLSRLVDRVFVSFEESKRYFPEGKTLVSGNPVRKSLLAQRERIHQGRGLLVLGGSLGARFLNDLMLSLWPKLFEKVPKLFLIHQTGLEDYERVRKAYEGHPLYPEVKESIRLYPFIEDMAWAYAQADLVLSRAGATTLAELMALEKPAILIPFPYATHQHQEKNAEVLVRAGAGLMFRQKDIEPEDFLQGLVAVLSCEERLNKLREAFKKLKRPNPERIIIEELKKLVAAEG